MPDWPKVSDGREPGRVYPGFVQLAAFMSMNIERHIKAHKELYENLRDGEIKKAEVTNTTESVG